ncbi:hypothetical protein BV913_06595 [Neisseria dumasiana]|uniref:Restriction endonuclease type I HsdR second RecA-like helicase domain-containing protein n=1 Tax=Neisseria dumasiana TaxID=1931275 RepID=A0ABX3WKU7_9NEIS|nr:hypothetical protein BV913_06595 [Neisseria dumasiana]
MSASAKEFLSYAINDYNATFKTNFSVESKAFQNYYRDLSLRVKNQEVDLLIVVGMFLTGFDAPTLNTLFVDKNLRYHGLLQAYSRTNRIYDATKTFGNIVTFRDDVVFEVDLLKSQEIDLDYILDLIFEHNQKVKNKSELVEEIIRITRASLNNRPKETLLVDFINQTNLGNIPDKDGVANAFLQFAQGEQRREAGELIVSEDLNEEATKRYITVSLKRGYASENGADLNKILPKMSPLNPQYLTKKQRVFQKISAFVDKYKEVGGDI